MPCSQCGDALVKGHRSCSDCGSAPDLVTIQALNNQLVGLTTQVNELVAARKGTEQRFLEVDTAERLLTAS
jgi:hypothetical protein